MRTTLSISIAGVLAAASGTVLAIQPAAATTEVDTDYGRMVLVLDASGSMAEDAGGTTKIAAAKKALETVIGELPEQAYVGLRVFGAKVFSRNDAGACTDTQLVVRPGTGNRDELSAAVADYEPYGETPIPAALRQAAQDIGSEGKRSIVLVSDGESTCDPDPCEVAAEIAEQGIDLQVDVVGLSVSGQARDQLRCIADRGNGTYYDAADAEDLTTVLSRVGERAANPYAAIGTPVTGGADASSATPVEAGDSLDTIGGAGSPTGQLWYRYERRIPGSTVHFTASVQQVVANPNASDHISVRPYAGSVECGFTQDFASRYQQPLIAAHAAVPGISSFQEECVEQTDLTFAVTRGDASGNGVAAEAPLEIRVIEEPPVSDEDAMAEGEEVEPSSIDLSAPVAGPAGGNSFGEATPIAPGAISGTLVPGETQIFKIGADWGQTVSAAVDLPPANQALAEALGPRGRSVTLWIYSPTRGLVSSAGGTNRTTFSGVRAASLRGHGYSVAWANRNSAVDQRAAASVAGDHYIAVTLVADEDEQSSAEVPFVLGADVTGEVRGVPTYAEGAQPIGEQPTVESDETPARDAEPAPRASDEEGGSTLALVAGGGAVAIGVLALLLATLMWLGRRRRAVRAE